jgi:uncharacterized membrane protein YdjX (TVP38/TMEM64 family)
MGERPKQRWLNIGLIITVVGVLGTLVGYYLSQCQDSICPSIQQFVASFGPWAPLIYAILYVAASPIPFVSTVLSATSGLLFGAILGALYTIIIATVSALVPFSIARRLGREWVESKLTGKRLDEVYEQSSGSNGFLFVLLMRLVPIIPWEIQNYIAGLTKIPIPTFLLATMIGIVPITGSLAFLGEAIQDPGSWQFYVAIGINIFAILIPVIVVYFRNRKSKREQAEQTEA